MSLDKTIRNMKSSKHYKTIKPDWREIIECIDSSRFAPMTGNNFTLKFIFVQDPLIIRRLADAAQQPFVSQAQIVVVAVSNPSRTVNLYGEQGKT